MNDQNLIKAIALAGGLMTAVTCLGVPAKPGLRSAVQPDGSIITYRLVGDEHFHYYMTADSILLTQADDGSFSYADRSLRSTGVPASDLNRRLPLTAARADELVIRPSLRRSARRTPEDMLTTTFPSTGPPRALVVLVQYADVKFTIPDPKAHYERLLNQPGFSDNGAVGSARDYFTTCSMGQFVPQFDIYGPITLKNRQYYYGANDSYGDDMYAYEMAIEACEQLDNEIDFNTYDTDGDGLIDNVYVFYAGKGEANGGSKNTVWPHSWDMSEADVFPMFDGVRLDHYACSNELYTSDYPYNETLYEGIGTFCHEFSHVLGLPDLYCTTYASAYTPGEWTLLDHGSYNGDGHVPPLYTAFERLSMGWMEPTVLTGPDDITLNPIVENKAYLIPTENDNEFFLLENRQQEGFDKDIPGHGMLVWHIDYDDTKWQANEVNNTSSHQCVDIEEADNSQSSYKTSRSGETFPGARKKTSFTDATSPNMRSWEGTALNMPLTEIAETPDGLITLKVAGGRAAGIGSAAADNNSGYMMNGRRVLADDGGTVTVYTAAGGIVGQGRSVEVPAPGVYIVAAGSTRSKIVVR